MKVLVSTSPLPASLPAALRVERQRELAGELLRALADRAERPDLRFERDDEGAPLPCDGWHHSVANTPGLVAVVLGPGPVGVDVERLDRPRLGAVRSYLAGDLAHLGRDDDDTLLYAWSSREAALKAAGVGIAGMPRLTRVAHDVLELAAADATDPSRTFHVARLPHPTHVLVVATEGSAPRIEEEDPRPIENAR